MESEAVMTNEEYLAIRENEWRRLYDYYDFSSVEGINSIPVPAYEVNGESATGRVEYYLKTQLFAECWESGNHDLAIACLKKANQLMFVSDMIWKRKDFMKLVKYLHILGKHEEAIAEEIKINRYFSNPVPKPVRISLIKKAIESADYLDTDFVEVTESMICCPECGKYIKRVFAFRGFHPFFPKLPKGFIDGSSGCCITIRPYVFGLDEESDREVKRECRFTGDKRSTQSKEMYRQWKAEVDSWDPYTNNYTNYAELYWLQQNLPDISPKTISGYNRMKAANSPKYQKIKEKAFELGYVIK